MLSREDRRDHRMLDAIVVFVLCAIVSWAILEATGGGWFTLLLPVLGRHVDRQLRASEEWGDE